MSTKRNAVSPINAGKEEKRLKESEDSVIHEDSDPDATIINTELLSSTIIDSSEFSDRIPSTMATNSELKKELQSVLCEPDIIEMISKVVAAQFTDILKKEMNALKDQLAARDREITALKDRVDELEQYGRRNSVRISGIPESQDENTDTIVKAVARAIDVDIDDSMIDRSHRVGPKPTSGAARPILVKMTSYRWKKKLMSQKRELAHVDMKKVFPKVQWSSAQSAPATRPRVYLNDDLTKTRSEIAAIARDKKRKKVIDNTWVTDGIIFVKIQDTVHRVTTKRGMDVF